MKKSFYILLVLFFTLLGTGFFLYNSQTTDRVLAQYAEKIKSQLDKDYAEVIQELSDPDFVLDSYSPEPKKSKRQERLYPKAYTILAYEHDSLAHWYNNKLFLTEELAKSVQDTAEGGFFFKTSNAYTYIVKKNFPEVNGHTRYGIGLIPIKYDYQLAKLSGSNTFNADKTIPISIGITNERGPHVLAGPAGGNVFLSANASFKDTPTQKKIILIFGLAFLVFLFLSNQIANILSRKSAHGTFFLVGMLTLVSLVIRFIDPANKLGGLGAIAEALKIQVLGASLFEVFFYAISFVWLMVYLNKAYVFKEDIYLSKWKNFAVSIALNISLMTGIVVVLEIYKQIIVWSKINISFLSLLQRKLNSILGLTLMLLALAALVLFALWMIKFIRRVKLNRLERALSIVIAFVLCLVVLFLLKSEHNSSIWYGTAILLPFGLDYYVSDKPKREPYAVYLWFALIAVFASVSLSLFQGNREMKEMYSYAQILSDERDTIAENLITNLVDQIAADEQWKQVYQAEPFFFDSKDVDLLTQKYFDANSYISNNYTYNFYLYTDSDASYEDHALMDQGLSMEEYRHIIQNATTVNEGDLHLRNTDDGSYSYFAERRIQSLRNAIIVLEVVAHPSGNANINSPIFSSYEAQSRMRNIGVYKYALFQHGACIRYKGDIQNQYFKLEQKPEIGTFLSFISNGSTNFVYHNPNGNIVILQKKARGIYDWFSLFAMLFFLISIIAVVINVLDMLFQLIPNGLNIKLLPGNTFYARIQSGFLILIYISFIAIGFVTSAHFNESNKKYHDGRLSRKSKTIRTAIGFTLNKLSGTTSIKTLQKAVEDEIIPLSKTHKMDVINFYNPKGKLVFSSKDEIYVKGVSPREMDANTFYHLSQKKSVLRINPERLGDVNFKSSYFDILHYGELVGYLGIPYYTKEQARLSDLNDFVTRLLITYFILFVMAISFIVYGTNTIAKPIQELSARVKQNKEIEWNTEDEFKGLVEAFNEGLRSKEIQHELQVKIEKESVWRDMAKQVAHDIKNPLTPIQLHIQHFQKSVRDRRMDLDQIEQRTDRLTQIVLTQIKRLLTTVEDFRDVANINEGGRENVSINRVLTDVAMLHESEEGITILLDLPREDIFVHGNKGKLDRVFSNLVKNAVQAIPDEQPGVIKIGLTIDDNQAIIKITDNGSGIPEHMTEKIFTPNFTTKNTGSGLGLHICKSIIESHSGQIDFVTEKDKGTTFTIRIKTSRIMSHLNKIPVSNGINVWEN